MKYYAFISYSHRDRIWGDWLHGRLETFRVPPDLVGEPSRDGKVPARMFPVFRDREELPTSFDLGSVITAALEQSRYLVVICSPNSARSQWVNEEILSFKRMGKEHRILALVVGGEPNGADKGALEQECFPDALKYQLDDNGELDRTRRAEPIAADARPAGDGKHNALRKLAAGILGVDYDQLRRRDEMRRRRRQRTILAASFSLTLLFAVLAGVAFQQWRLAEAREKQVRDGMAQGDLNHALQLGETNLAEKLALLARAARLNAGTPFLDLVLWQTLAFRSWLMPAPSPVEFPVPLADGLLDSSDQWLAAIGQDGKLYAASLLERNAELLEDSARHTAMVFVPGRPALLTGRESGEVALWDLSEKRRLALFQPHQTSVSCVAASADRAMSCDANGRVILYSLKEGREVRRWEIGAPVFKAALHPSLPAALVMTERAGAFLLRTDADAKPVAVGPDKLPVPRPVLDGIFFGADMALLLGGDRFIYGLRISLGEPSTLQAAPAFSWEAGVPPILIRPLGGDLAAIGHSDGAVTVIDGKTLKVPLCEAAPAQRDLLRDLTGDGWGRIFRLYASNRVDALVYGESSPVPTVAAQVSCTTRHLLISRSLLELFVVGASTKLASFQAKPFEAEPVRRLAIPQPGARFRAALANQDRSLWFSGPESLMRWDLPDTAPVKVRPSGPLYALEAGRDGTRIVSMDGKKVSVLDAAAGTIIREAAHGLDLSDEFAEAGLAWGGEWCAAWKLSRESGSVWILPLSASAPVKLELPHGIFFALADREPGRIWVVAFSGEMQCLDWTTGAVVETIASPGDGGIISMPRRAALSRDGRVVALGMLTGEVLIVDRTTQKRSLLHGNGPVALLDFLPGDGRIVLADDLGMARLLARNGESWQVEREWRVSPAGTPLIWCGVLRDGAVGTLDLAGTLAGWDEQGRCLFARRVQNSPARETDAGRGVLAASGYGRSCFWTALVEPGQTTLECARLLPSLNATAMSEVAGRVLGWELSVSGEMRPLESK